MREDIRWRQRFQNFEKTLQYLEDALNIEKPDIIQRAGVIRFFEMSLELAWKTMKDYLEHGGFIDINSPRNVIKKGFETGLIKSGHMWLQALEDRNLTSHAYDEETIFKIEVLIRTRYIPC